MSVNSLGIQRSASDANLERCDSKSYKQSHLHLHIPKGVKKSPTLYSKESDGSSTSDSIGGKVDSLHALVIS